MELIPVIYMITIILGIIWIKLTTCLKMRSLRWDSSHWIYLNENSLLYTLHCTYDILYRGRKEKDETNLLSVTGPSYPSNIRLDGSI